MCDFLHVAFVFILFVGISKTTISGRNETRVLADRRVRGRDLRVMVKWGSRCSQDGDVMLTGVAGEWPLRRWLLMQSSLGPGKTRAVSGNSRSRGSGVKVVGVQDMWQVTPQVEQDRQGATCEADPGVWRGMTWCTWR